MKQMTLPDLDHCPAHYIANCIKCGGKGYKRDMTVIYVRKGSYTQLNKLGHMCDCCVTKSLDEIGVPMP